MFQPLFVRSLTEDERKQLALRARSLNKEEARRAGVVLLSSEGKTASDIARSLGFHPSNVKKWVRKFNEEGLAGIAVRKRGPREGPRPSFTRDQVDRLLELAGTVPAEIGYSFERWTAQKLANAAIKEGIVDKISHVTVQQILKRGVSGRKSPDSDHPGREPKAHADEPLKRGKHALEQSQFEDAVGFFRGAMESAGNSADKEAEIRCFLSQALEELCRYDEAHSVLQRYEDGHELTLLQPRTRAQVKLRLGWAYDWLKDQAKAIAWFNDAKRVFLDLQDQHGICEVNYAIGRTYIGLSEFRIARDHLLSALSSLEGAGDRALAARVYVQFGTIDFYEGAFRNSKENYLKALALAEGHADRNLIGIILLNLGISYDDDSPTERNDATEYNRRGIACLQESGHKDLSLAYNNLADALRLSGLWEEALESLKRAIEIAQRFSDPVHEATARATTADILLAKGRYSEAESQARRCMEFLRDGTEKWLESYALRLLGGIEQATGKGDVALATLRNALRLSTSAGDLHGLTLAQVALAETHFAQGGYDQAREYLELAQGRLKEEKSRSLFITGLIQRLIGQIEAISGHYAVAKQHVAQSISIFTTTEIPYEAARSRHSMGLLLAATGENRLAEAHLLEAKRELEHLGAEPAIVEIDKALDLMVSGAGPTLMPQNGLSGLTSEATRAGSEEDASTYRDTGDRNWIAASSPVGPANDVLLMQRLIEASASRDLLLQELASIVYENFPVEFALVFRLDGSAKPDVLVSKGIGLKEACSACLSIDPSLPRLEDESGAVMHLVHLSSMSDDGPGRPGKLASPCLYLRFRAGAGGDLDCERLQPLIRQVELGLEACSLRAAAAVAAPARIQDRVQVVMPGFIVGSPPMFEVVAKIQKIRTSDVTVLITGESGTGKELVARALHAESARARAIFLPFNCTATPRDLIESQLFGHRRGAFTGATTNYPGMVRAAEGGTLFLDEIGDVALEVQPKLMRFLQEGEIQPLGETRPIKVDVRVAAATNTDLERAVEEGRFREDLFHRLNIIRIHVPPLRERREEIPVLASFFLDHFAARSGKPRLTLAQDAMDALTGYEWPGNVRQLRNEIERVTAYASEGGRVGADDLTPEVANGSRHRSSLASRGSAHASGTDNGQGAATASGRGNQSPGNGSPAKLKEAVADLETRLIKDSLERNRNNVSRTAAELGLSRRGLRLKLAQLGIGKNGPAV